MTEIYAQQMACIAGKKTFEAAIFGGNPEQLVTELDKKGIPANETVDLLESMNYDMHSQDRGVSQFADIQHRLAQATLNAEGISHTSKTQFSNWIVENPELLHENIDYQNIGAYGTATLVLDTLESKNLEAGKSITM